MATDDYIAANSSLSKEPQYVLEIDFAGDGTDLYYFTGSASTPVPSGAGSVTEYSTIKKFSSTSQRLRPEIAKATIGVMDFTLVNLSNAIRDLLNTKYVAGSSLREKRVRFYFGYEGLVWADFIMLQTQLIETISHSWGEYRFKCKDVQRTEKKNLFVTNKTNLQADYTAGDTTLNVFDTSDFEIYPHGNSFTDAPNTDVYYVRLKVGNTFNIIRATGKTATTFTGCVGGRLGTIDVDIAIDSDGTTKSDQQPLIEEHIYLEMPAPKLIYALLTGNLEGQAGKVLPSNCHLGLDTAYVDLASFTGIGSDFWNTSNDDGFILRFNGLGKVEGKQFIEKQCLLPIRCFTPVQADGSLKLSRTNSILTDSNYSEILDESNIISVSPLKHDLSAVRNLVFIDWNYEFLVKDFTRTLKIADGDSASVYDISDPLNLSFQGMSGYRHTASNLYDIYDGIQDRYAGEPLLISVRTFLRMSTLQLADLLLLQLSGYQDYLNGTSLARVFELQEIKINWMKGVVDLRLFGSGSKASAVNRASTNTVIDDSWYSATGVNIETYLAAYITDIAGVLHVDTNGGTLVGGSSTMTVYYSTKPLNIDSGITLNYTGNVLIKVMDVFNIDGSLDGGSSSLSDGGLGYTKAQGGGTAVEYTSGYSYIRSVAALPVGDTATIPHYDIVWDGTDLKGLPARLDGRHGVAGGDMLSEVPAVVSAGGAGGVGGAGLITLTRGTTFGAGGVIDSSGGAGVDAVGVYFLGYHKAGGTGAGGAAGYWLDVLDGSAAINTAVDSNVVMFNGDCSPPNQANGQNTDTGVNGDGGTIGNAISSYYSGFPTLNHNLSNWRSQYINDISTPAVEILPNQVSAPTSLVLTSDEGELLELRDGTKIPQLTGTWVNTTSQNFKGCRVEYKKSSASEWVSVLGITAYNATSHSVMDVEEGVNYDFRVASVSKVGNLSGWTTITAHTIVGKTSVPADVTGFSVYQNGVALVMKWDANTEADLFGYEFRYLESGGSDLWADGTLLNKATKGTNITTVDIPDGTWFVMVKALDTSGNESANIASATVEFSSAFDVIDTESFAPDFVGTLTNMVRHHTVKLVPDSQDAASIDTWDTFDITVPNPFVDCYYEVAEYDNGFDDVSRVSGVVTSALVPIDPVGVADPHMDIDYRLAAGSYDGFEHISAGNIEFRYLKARVHVDTSVGVAIVSEFTRTVDAIEWTQKAEGVAIGSGGTAITFPLPFHNSPYMSVLVVSATAALVTIENKSGTGVTINLFNSSGTQIAGVVDWSATGV